MRNRIDFHGAKAEGRGRYWRITLANGKVYQRKGPGDWQGWVTPTRDGGHKPHWHKPVNTIIEQLETNFRRIGK